MKASLGFRPALRLSLIVIVAFLTACDTRHSNTTPTLDYDVSFTTPIVPALNAKTPSALQVYFPANAKALEKARKKSENDVNYEDNIFTRVFRADLNLHSLDQKIKMEPAVDGHWTKTGNYLNFQPKYHWPANVTYKVAFSSELFMDHVRLNKKEYEFTTRSLEVITRNTKLHTDPAMNGEFRFISTMQFSHPVNIDVLRENYQLVIADETADAIKVPFTLTAHETNNGPSERLYYVNSEKIDINGKTRFLTASLPQTFAMEGINQQDPTRGSTPKSAKQNKDLVFTSIPIPNVADIFKVTDTSTLIVHNDDKVPEQALTLQFSIPTSADELREHIKLKLLPKKNPNDPSQQWLSTNEITPTIEDKLSDVDFKLLPTAAQYSEFFSLVFDAPEDRQVVLQITKGLPSSVGYVSNRDYGEIHTAPQYPAELAFLGDGNVLDSNGSHKIGFVTRNFTELKVDVGRIDQRDLNHLISQTRGRFDDLRLLNGFTMADLSVISTRTIPLNNREPAKPVYSSYDLTRDLVDKNQPTGVFMIKVTARNRINYTTEEKRQLVLITDIGFITKRNADGSRDVFVQKISEKAPLAQATIAVLGRNGRSAFNVSTNDRGHATLPNLSNLRGDKEPVALMVTTDSDFAYLPLLSQERQLNLSRFETGGQYLNSNDAHSLSAFMFTDRGIYRPGENVNIAAIVRDTNIQINEPFSVRISVIDPRGNTIYQKPHLLGRDGLLEMDLDTTREFNTGNYTATISLHVDGSYYKHLGAVNFTVEEFEPDRLKIKSTLSNNVLRARTDRQGNSIAGWLNEDELNFNVSLNNLFGTPAQNRKITADYALNRAGFVFPKFPKYSFTENVVNNTNQQIQNQAQLSPTQTNDAGTANLSLDLNKYFGGTYQVTLRTQGFEQNGGRSVHAQNAIKFSPREYLVGYSVADQHYMKQSQAHSIKLLCIDKYVTAIDCDFKIAINKIETISTLVAQANGTYQYQSIPKIHELSRKALSIPDSGYVHRVNTEQTGNYQLALIDGEGQTRQTISYRVVGNENTNAELDKDAQLELVLDKKAYATGDWIELQIKAPYTGSGLISIETDKTHAFKWFNTNTTQSIQRIQVPEGLQGNAYIQVAFVRSPGSKEVFTAPLSYAVAPFDLSKDEFEMTLSLNAPEKASPGDTLTVNYKSTHEGRAIIFAVDEGILQAGNYANPDPLSFFLQKRALQVDTYQMFDMLLPEFDLLQALSASGGGAGSDMAETSGSNLNPFARKVKDPVAFWSGIVPTGTTSQSVEFDLPDHFDGTLRIMAIALDAQRFDSTSARVTVKGPFVVTPNLPLVVSPGDKFTIAVGVSNQMEPAPKASEVDLQLASSPYFTLLGTPKLSKQILKGDEHTYLIELRANDKLGSADLSFVASSYNDQISRTVSRQATATVSVRPSTLLRSTLKSGKTGEEETVITAERGLLEDLSTSELIASNNPSILIDGLTAYLDVFPHACTEQIVSKLSPVLSFLDHPTYLGSPQAKLAQVESAFASLGRRQLPNGGFSLWPRSQHVEDIPSVHVLHALIDANERGIRVPNSIIDNGVNYLKEFSLNTQNMRTQPELTAYALYLLTRQGEQTNNALIQLQAILDNADSNKQKDQHANQQTNQPTNRQQIKWQDQLVGAYMAASFKILRRDEDAIDLIRLYKFREKRKNKNHYDSSLYRDSMVVYLMAKHFETEFGRDDATRLDAIIEPILNNSINTYSSGRALVALKAYSDLISTSAIDLSIETTETLDDKKHKTTAQWTASTELDFDPESSKYTATLNANINAVKIVSKHPTYYQAKQIGFDSEPPASELDNGIEVTKAILNANGEKLSASPAQGDDVLIKIKVRSSNGQHHQAVAIVDLLPGGFEIDAKDARQRQQSGYDVDYLDIREDRLVVYTSVSTYGLEIVYKARVTTAGEFTVPAAYANAMYDDATNGHSSSAKLIVSMD